MRHIFRFFADIDDEGIARLDDDDRRHLAQVLRLRTGAEVEVGDGRGRVFRAVVEDPSAGLLRCTDELGAVVDLAPVRVLLGQSGSRADDAVEKLVELGVAEIGPLEVAGRRHPARRDRWERIARAAAAQAKLTRIPVILDPVVFADALVGSPIVCSHERDEGTLADALVRTTRPIVLLIGPEVGFTEDELAQAVKAGCPIASLGPTVLRSETAAIVAATLAVAHVRADTLRA